MKSWLCARFLLESRSMVADEMMPILDRLIDCCVPERNKAVVQSLVANEAVSLCLTASRQEDIGWAVGDRYGGPQSSGHGDPIRADEGT